MSAQLRDLIVEMKDDLEHTEDNRYKLLKIVVTIYRGAFRDVIREDFVLN